MRSVVLLVSVGEAIGLLILYPRPRSFKEILFTRPFKEIRLNYPLYPGKEILYTRPMLGDKAPYIHF